MKLWLTMNIMDREVDYKCKTDFSFFINLFILDK